MRMYHDDNAELHIASLRIKQSLDRLMNTATALAIAFIAMTPRSLNTLTTDDKFRDAARPNDKMTSMTLADKV